MEEDDEIDDKYIESLEVHTLDNLEGKTNILQLNSCIKNRFPDHRFEFTLSVDLKYRLDIVN